MESEKVLEDIFHAYLNQAPATLIDYSKSRVMSEFRAKIVTTNGQVFMITIMEEKH